MQKDIVLHTECTIHPVYLEKKVQFVFFLKESQVYKEFKATSVSAAFLWMKTRVGKRAKRENLLQNKECVGWTMFHQPPAAVAVLSLSPSSPQLLPSLDRSYWSHSPPHYLSLASEPRSGSSSLHRFTSTV